MFLIPFKDKIWEHKTYRRTYVSLYAYSRILILPKENIFIKNSKRQVSFSHSYSFSLSLLFLSPTDSYSCSFALLFVFSNDANFGWKLNCPSTIRYPGEVLFWVPPTYDASAPLLYETTIKTIIKKTSIDNIKEKITVKKKMSIES